MRTYMLLRWGGLVSILVAALLTAAALLRFGGVRDGAVIYPEWVVAGAWLELGGFVLAMFAMVALYGAQFSQSGRLGWWGFMVTMVGIALANINSYPWIPFYDGRLGGPDAIFFHRGAALLPSSGLLLVGLIMFGIATLRAGVFPRPTGPMLAGGEVLVAAGGWQATTTALLIVWLIGNLVLNAGLAWMGWTLLSDRPEAAWVHSNGSEYSKGIE
jgi:hypothetical protein